MSFAYRFLQLTTLVGCATACVSCGSHAQNGVIHKKYVHKYGVAVSPGYWKSSGEDGGIVSTLANGIVLSHSYASGQLDGETKYTFPHSSQIEKTEFYKEGILVKEIEFFFDGTPKYEIQYDYPETGFRTVSNWYLNSVPNTIEIYQDKNLVKGEYFTTSNQRDGVVDNSEGTRLIRDDYGQLLSTDTIVAGQLSLRTTYFPNGSPREVIPYKLGIVEGLKRSFNPAGDPSSIETWVDGEQIGQTTFFQHGHKSSEVTYVANQKCGKETRYRDGEAKVQEISWDQGVLHGATTTYLGDVIKVDWYYQGKPTTKGDFEHRTAKALLR